MFFLLKITSTDKTFIHLVSQVHFTQDWCYDLAFYKSVPQSLFNSSFDFVFLCDSLKCSTGLENAVGKGANSMDYKLASELPH